MKRVLFFWFFAGLVLAGLVKPASAQTLLGTLSKKHNSVIKVMEAAGCSYTLLAEVLLTSKIDSADVRRLPVGQPVYSNSDCRKSTEKLTAQHLAKLGQVRDSLTVALRQVTAATVQVNHLKTAVLKSDSLRSAVNKQLVATQASLIEAKVITKSQLLLALFVGVITGFVVAYAAWYFTKRRLFKPQKGRVGSQPIPPHVIDHDPTPLS